MSWIESRAQAYYATPKKTKVYRSLATLMWLKTFNALLAIVTGKSLVVIHGSAAIGPTNLGFFQFLAAPAYVPLSLLVFNEKPKALYLSMALLVLDQAWQWLSAGGDYVQVIWWLVLSIQAYLILAHGGRERRLDVS